MKTMDNERLIRDFYQAFNERRFNDAAAMFRDDAVLEHAALGRQQRGGEGYLQFVAMWTAAFPDAALTVERVASRVDHIYEVELLAVGTHVGALEMGSAGVFKPSGVRASLRLRQLFEIHEGRIRFSSLSFDVQDIVHQLVRVDDGRLLEHIHRIQQLAVKLSGMPAEDLVERRNLIDRLGTELDAARRVVRPYFGRS
jgi:steroid delta-isomerase-like uncharacterized protein